MRPIIREPRICSELVRTPDELKAYWNLPRKLRPRRYITHSEGTVNAYLYALCSHYFPACVRMDVEPFPCSVEQLCRAVADIEERSGPKAAHNMATVVRCYHFANDLPAIEGRELTLCLKDIRRRNPPKRALALTTEQVLAMCRMAEAIRSPLRAARDIALMLLAFAAALRPSELLAATIENIKFKGPAMVVRIPRSKTDQEARGQHVTVVRALRSPLCPIAAIKHLMQQAKIETGPLFFHIWCNETNASDIPLTYTGGTDIIKTYGSLIGIDRPISFYSFRRGCATTAYQHGAPVHQIQDHLRHKYRESTLLYIDDVPLPPELSLTPLVLP